MALSCIISTSHCCFVRRLESHVSHNAPYILSVSLFSSLAGFWLSTLFHPVLILFFHNLTTPPPPMPSFLLILIVAFALAVLAFDITVGIWCSCFVYIPCCSSGESIPEKWYLKWRFVDVGLIAVQ